MSGKRAKALRQRVYGEVFSFRDRQYKKKENGSIVCTGLRREYQNLKREI